MLVSVGKGVLKRTCTLLVATGFLSGSAWAARPVPDRPFENRSGFLITRGSLELEAGGQWADGFAVPARLKYGAGTSFEPRVSANLAGLGEGYADLALEGKIKIHRSKTTGLAAYLASALPVGGEPWWGTARVLVSTRLDGLLLGANTGIDFEGGGGSASIGGVPMEFLLGTSFGSSMSGHFEGAFVVNGGIHETLVDLGLRWTPTEIMALDAIAGWRLEEDQPYLGAGMTINLGTPGG